MPIVDETVTSEVIPMIDEVARQTGATVVDLHTPTEGKVYLTYDYVHPWTEGTTLMARHIAPAIDPNVELPETESGFWQRVEEFDRTDRAVTSAITYTAWSLLEIRKSRGSKGMMVSSVKPRVRYSRLSRKSRIT